MLSGTVKHLHATHVHSQSCSSHIDTFIQPVHLPHICTPELLWTCPMVVPNVIKLHTMTKAAAFKQKGKLPHYQGNYHAPFGSIAVLERGRLHHTKWYAWYVATHGMLRAVVHAGEQCYGFYSDQRPLMQQVVIHDCDDPYPGWLWLVKIIVIWKQRISDN